MNPLAPARRPIARRVVASGWVAIFAAVGGLVQAADLEPIDAADLERPTTVDERVEPVTLLATPASRTAAADALPRPVGTGRLIQTSPGLQPGHVAPTGGWADWRVLGAMVAAFAVLAALRFVNTRRDRSLPPDVFEVLGSAPFAGQHAVRVVRFGPRTLLVAVSSGGCATLAELTDAEATASIAAACRGDTPRRRPATAAAPRPTTPRDPPPSSEPDHTDRPGRRIAAAVIGWIMCLIAATASAEPVPETATPSLTPLPSVAADGGDATHAERPAAPSTEAGLLRLLTPRTVEALVPSALLVGVMSLVPAVLLMTTCFVRMSIVLMLLRQGLGAAQVPSNQILASLALFLSALVMWPVWTDAWRGGVEPYRQGVLEPAEAFERGTLPIRRWMSAQIEAAGNRDTMLLFLARHPAGQRQATSYDDVPLETLLPAFLVSELDVAFTVGFRMLLPFLVLDILVATLVVSTGLVMLPPTLVSLPLKLLVFVAADGWTLVVRGLLDGVGLRAG